MYSSRDEHEGRNTQGYVDIWVDFLDFKISEIQDFSKDFKISRSISKGLYEISGLFRTPWLHIHGDDERLATAYASVPRIRVKGSIT